MAKSNAFENKAFQQTTPNGVGFNLVHQVNNLHSVFNTKPLDSKESQEIEKILVDNFRPGKTSEDQVKKDFEKLKLITSEIKAIGKQGIVLMGERVHLARELLKPYKDGAFTRWLESTFSTRKTGYNMLSYYDLYMALPSEGLKERFKKIPQRVAYILASRNGHIDTKSEIISDYYDRPHNEILILIKEKMPMCASDKRTGKSSNEKLIIGMKSTIQKLKRRRESLSQEDLMHLKEIAKALCSI